MKAFISLMALALVEATPFLAFQVEAYANEIQWEIHNHAGFVCGGGPYPGSGRHRINDCHFGNGDYQLKCIDSYGDGWHGGYIIIGEQNFCQNFMYGHLQAEYFSWNGDNSFNYDSTGGFSGENNFDNKYIPISEERRGGEGPGSTNRISNGEAVDES